MNTDDLRFFLTVANSGSLAMAARSLEVTPPNISQRLQSLEKKVGFTLIQRPARQVILTDEGWLIFDKAKKIIEEIDNLTIVLDERKGCVSGKLRVLAPLGFGGEYIAPIISEFSKMHPSLKIELSLSDLPSWKNFNEWDVIIYIGELRDSSLFRIKLCENSRYLCASPEYLAKNGVPKTPEGLKDHQCIVLRENDEDVTLWKFYRGDEQFSVRVNPHLSTNHGKTVRFWGEQGMGLFIRSGWDVKKSLDEKRLVRLLDDFEIPNADIVALTNFNHKSRPLRIQHFIEIMQERLLGINW